MANRTLTETVATQRAQRGDPREVLRSRLVLFAPLIALLALIVLFSILSPVFLTSANMLNLVRQMAVLLVVALGAIATVAAMIVGAAWLGAPGVLIGQAAGGVIFGLAGVWLALRVIARGGRAEGVDHFTHQARMIRLFQGRK